MAKTLKNLVRTILPRKIREQVEEVRHLGLPLPLRVVRSHTLVSIFSMLYLQELMRRIGESGTEGDIVECGVYRGGSAAVLGWEMMRLPGRRHLWLYDAFQGMPAASDHDDDYSKSIVGQFVGSEANARRLLHRLKVPETRFHIVAGWFNDTLPVTKVSSIALLHIDCDFYEPVNLVLNTLYKRVAPQGYVVLNDYGSFTACKKATDEFLKGLDSSIKLQQIDRDAYFFQKPQESN